MEANEAQVFAWQARCKGIDVHALAEPTKLEALKKEFNKEKSATDNEQRKVGCPAVTHSAHTSLARSLRSSLLLERLLQSDLFVRRRSAFKTWVRR